MKLTKKLLATVLVVALTIAAVPVMGATVDATNTVPNKKSLMKLVDEFSTPIGVTEEYIMGPGKSVTYNFSKVTARADMLRFKAEKKKEVNKYSKRMFGKKTSKVTLYPGEWGDSKVVMEIGSIKKNTKKNYYVKGQVYFTNLRDGKKHLVGTFRLYVQRKKTAKYKYVATKLKLTKWKKATTKSSKVNLFSSAKKYKNIKATMTYQLITVSGVDGAKAINKALRGDMDALQKSNSANNFYQWVAEDDAKKIKDNYYFTATSKVKYNMNNILSVRITIHWYVGGAENTDEYGYNFDARTGKQIGIKKVVKGSTKTIKKKMYKAIDKKNWSKSYKKKAKKYIKKTKLSKLEFYMKNDKVIICMEPYTLGKKQREFKSFYIFSIYF